MMDAPGWLWCEACAMNHGRNRECAVALAYYLNPNWYENSWKSDLLTTCIQHGQEDQNWRQQNIFLPVGWASLGVWRN